MRQSPLIKQVILFSGSLLIALCFSFSVVAQPTITSFSPTSGPIGTVVTITGTNFDTTPVNNIVLFGATQATVSAATTTNLTVTVPMGATYMPITVLVSGLLAYSSSPFVVTFAGDAIDANSFATKVGYLTGGNGSTGVSIADLDGDGKADLAVTNEVKKTVSIYRNTSSSGTIDATSFATKVDFSTGTGAFSISIGDLDGDGKADLAVANFGSSTISVFRNTSSSGTIDANSFASKVDFSTGSGPRSVFIGDLDGDGRADLAVANQNSNTVSVLKNISSIGTIDINSFETKVDYPAGTDPFSVSIGDLDGDGKADLAVANFTSNTVSVYRNTSTSGTIDANSFDTKVDYISGLGLRSISIGDLDGDGKPDLAIANGSSNNLSVFRNTSTSGIIDANSFDTKVDFVTGSFPVSVSMGDLNGDGKTDLAVINLSSNTVSIYKNTSTSGTIDANSFDTKVDFSTEASSRAVSIGDLDGDGKADLAVASSSSSTVSVFRNLVVPSTETDISAFSFPEQTGAAIIDAINHTIDIEVTFGTDMTGLAASFVLSSNASAEIGATPQISGITTNDFSSAVTYTVTAQDAITTQDWQVTVTIAQNTETDITAFSLIEQTGAAVIDEVNHTVDIEVTFGTDVTALIPSFTLSIGASATVNAISQISGVTSNNFNNPITYTVIAQDGITTQDWIVTVSSPQTFITTWLTTNPNESITVPTTGIGYGYTVDWGDGSVDATVYAEDATHIYITAGTYTVSIKGSFPRIYFNDSGSKDKIQTIEQWGNIAWKSMESAFYGCSQLTYNATDVPDLSSVTDMSMMFRLSSNFNGDIGNWDVSAITNMASMFYAANAFNQDISGWNVGSVTSMEFMFYNALAFNQDLNNWNIGAVTNLTAMFSGASAFNQNLSNWDVSAVTSMSIMFSGATNFNENITTWDVSNVLNMEGMFDGASAFDQDLSSWNMSNVLAMNGMFANAVTFNQDIGNWDVSSATAMSAMFSGAIAFNQDLSSWDVSAVIGMIYMFNNATSFNQNLGNWDISSISEMEGMLVGTAMSTVNYDNTLIGWSSLSANESAIPTGVILDTDLFYCTAVTERDELINTYGWTINGDANSCPPVPDVAILPDLSDCTTITPTAPTATDLVDGSITGVTATTFPITTPGTTKMIWTYTNAAGNKATQIQNVIIEDVLAPVLDVASLADVTAECTLATLTTPTATDNCSGAITGTANTTFPITAQGTTVVTWTYTDDAGNETTQTQNVIIKDVTAPVADKATLTDATAECSLESLTAPTATDNCLGTITATTDTTFPITAQGTTVITWTYTDNEGNKSTQTQNVIIKDAIAPVADMATLTDVTAECNLESLTSPTAMDNCSGTITGTTDATFPITTQGTTVITWTYTDNEGNKSTQTQNVIIKDATAPVADNATLADVTAECSLAELTAPTATDNCSGTITGTTDTTFPITAQGTTVITWTYTDSEGNKSTQTQNIVIEDATAPVVDNATLADVTAECSLVELTAPTATDNCSGIITGTTDTTFPITAQGTTVITWTYTDSEGNESTQTQNVIINCITGINTPPINLSIYPNPTQDQIQFLGNSGLIEQVLIYDTSGNEVEFQQLSPSVYEISTLSAGVYLVRVRLKNETMQFRLIKE